MWRTSHALNEWEQQQQQQRTKKLNNVEKHVQAKARDRLQGKPIPAEVWDTKRDYEWKNPTEGLWPKAHSEKMKLLDVFNT